MQSRPGRPLKMVTKFSPLICRPLFHRSRRLISGISLVSIAKAGNSNEAAKFSMTLLFRLSERHSEAAGVRRNFLSAGVLPCSAGWRGVCHPTACQSSSSVLPHMSGYWATLEWLGAFEGHAVRRCWFRAGGGRVGKASLGYAVTGHTQLCQCTVADPRARIQAAAHMPVWPFPSINAFSSYFNLIFQVSLQPWFCLHQSPAQTVGNEPPAGHVRYCA